MSLDPVIEKIRTRLQASELGDYFNEGDISTIAREAIHRAFFTRATTAGSSSVYSSSTSSLSKQEEIPIVDMAKTVFRSQMEDRIKLIVEDLCETPEFHQTISQCIVAMLPGIIMSGMREHIIGSVVQGLSTHSWEASEKITEIVEARFGINRQ